MKLIDILVEELPKRGGWPEGRNYAWQDETGEIRFDTEIDCDFFPQERVLCEKRRPIGKIFIDVSDSFIVTREQYEAALAAKNDGWIDWGGGECPVDASEMVDVIFGHGGRMSTNIADCWRWNHEGTDSDIISYRPHKPQEVTEADGEADLNECIGQAPELVWNGEGLPPIGCECERSWCGDNWLACTVLFLSAETVVVKLATKEAAYGVSEVKFRPIRSEADKKRDEAKHTIAELCRSASSNGHAADLIYDAIAAGKVRGVKLED